MQGEMLLAGPGSLLLQRPPSLSAPPRHQGQRWRLPCHPHLQFSLPAAPAAALQPQLTALRLPVPGDVESRSQLGRSNRTGRADPEPPRTATPSILPVGSGGAAHGQRVLPVGTRRCSVVATACPPPAPGCPRGQQPRRQHFTWQLRSVSIVPPTAVAPSCSSSSS